MSKEIQTNTNEVFANTREIPLNSKGILDWSVNIPTAQDAGLNYFETSRKENAKRTSTRLTKEGKILVNTNWQAFLLSEEYKPENLNLETMSIDDIREKSNNFFSSLSADTNSSQDFIRLMRRSFEGRIRYLENQKFWAEMDASNSPWNDAVGTISTTLYSNLRPEFVRNFATHSIIRLKEQVDENVQNYVQSGNLNAQDRGFVTAAYEARIANHIARYLTQTNQGKRTQLREAGVGDLVNNVLNERRFTNQDQDHVPLSGYMNKTLESVLEEKDKISLIKADDIHLTDLGSSALPDPTIREIINRKASELRQALGNLVPRVSDKRKVVASLTAIFGVALMARGVSEKISSWDVYQEWMRQPDPISQQISPDLVLAYGLTDENVVPEPAYEVVPQKATATARSEKKKPIKTATQTATNIPTETPNPTATPTPEPDPPLVFGGIDFSQEEIIESQVTLKDGTVLDLSLTPKLYEDSSTSTETGALFEEMKESLVAAVDSDNYGNTLLYVDSGYQGTEPLDAEDWRAKIEGGSIDPNIPLFGQEQRQENINDLIGTTIPVTQGGSTEQFVISAIGYVPHDQVESFGENTKTALDVLVNITGEENSPFAVYKDPQRNAILYVFCGWGARGQNRWWVYSRYVVALEPVNNAPVQIQPASAENTDNISLSVTVPTPAAEGAAQTEMESPYLSEVRTVTEAINNYSETYSYDGNGPKPETTLGEYLKESEWYAQKTDEEKSRMEDILRLIDAKTYSYSDPQGGYQAIQCIDYAGLLFSFGEPESPRHNLVGSGTNVVFPGDAVVSISEYRNFDSYQTVSLSLDSLTPGSLLITSTHVLIVVENTNGTIWITDANRNKDGRADLFSVSDTAALEEIIGTTVYIE